jgi:WD40 repeat protein
MNELEQVFAPCWLLGTMISSTLLLISLARQSIWLRRLRRIEDDDWVNSVTTAARTLGLHRPLVALESDAACVPTVVGVLAQRVLAILDPRRRRDPVGARFASILPCVVGIVCGVLGGETLTTHSAIANPSTESHTAILAEDANRVWKENYTVEYPGTLPVSVAFSADGKTLLTGDTGGEIMALIFAGDEPRWRWKSKVEGSHAAVAFSTDQKKVYATTEHGVRILDAASGKEAARIEVHDSNPTAIGVFSKKTIAENFIRAQIVFGNPRGYFVKSWAEGGTAVTGDAAGRVIVWDAKTMKEARRLELGGRVAALAISDDGVRTAAYVLRKQAEVYVWETAKPIDTMKPIHTELGDFGGPTAFASLSFSPDGKQLAGCAIDKRWLSRLGELTGKVRVWELSAEPKAQLPPKHVYIKQLPKGSSKNFVVLDNNSILMPATEQGAVDFRRIADGDIQARFVLGKFTIGGMKLSSDRKWLALEQHAPTNHFGAGVPAESFEVAVYESTLCKNNTTIPSCRQLLDVAAGGKVVAVVREQQIELWDSATTKKLKAAPFQHTRIDAASFSPDGRLLALSDRNELVLWRWEENTHERIDLGRCVGSLMFSPDGKFLAEGPTPHQNIQIRNVETRKVVQTLANGAKLKMNVPRMAYSQGGRVLIACDNITFVQETAVPHRINLWDMADGSLAHQLPIPAGLPQTLDVSPNGRNLVAMLEDSEGVKLSVWRLDGENSVKEAGPTPPAAVGPR